MSLRLRIPLALATVVIVAGPRGLRGQHSNAVARTSIGVSAGYMGGLVLWDVPDQNLRSSAARFPDDTVHLRRTLQPDVTIRVDATHYLNDHVGLRAEANLLIIHYRDACATVFDGGDTASRAICPAVSSTPEEQTSYVTLNAGIIVRASARSYLQPYFTVVGGLADTPVSTVPLRSEYGQAVIDSLQGALDLQIYTDPGWRSVRFTGSAGVGIITAPTSGLQFHVEARETWIPLAAVAHRSAAAGLTTPVSSVWQMLPTIVVGIDLALGRARSSKRY